MELLRWLMELLRRLMESLRRLMNLVAAHGIIAAAQELRRLDASSGG
jgi:hypothetical protein